MPGPADRRAPTTAPTPEVERAPAPGAAASAAAERARAAAHRPWGSGARPLTWVIGSGGLVGSHVAAALAEAGHDIGTVSVPWEVEDAAVEALAAAARRFAEARRGRPWAVAWCAGAGVVSSDEDTLAAEVRVFRRTLAALAQTVHLGEDGVLFLASSAGGLYAGSAEPPFDERTPPRPLVPYGWAKLVMEREAAAFGRQTGVRVVLGRLANVYGPGQRLAKPQGLVSKLCLADATGHPLPLFVAMDTIRDYLYAGDAGRMVERSIALARREPPGTVVTKVLASGGPVTVGQLVSEARRVFHRRLRTIPVGGAGGGQVLDLRLRSRVWPEVDAVASTTLVSGLSRTAADVRARVVAGGPLDP